MKKQIFFIAILCCAFGTASAQVPALTSATRLIFFKGDTTFRATVADLMALAPGDNWGTQTVVTTGSTLSGNGASGSPLQVASGGITATEIADGTIVNADVSSSANIANSKLANSGVTAGTYPTTGGIIPIITVNSKGIITGIVEAANVDPSSVNEGVLGVGAATSTSALITSNTSSANGVTVNAGTSLEISESTSSNGGSFTLGVATSGITATQIAASSINSSKIRDTTIVTADLKDAAVTGAKIAQSGATSGQVLTWNGSTWTPSTPSGGATDLTFSGSSSPVTLNSSTGADVTFTAAGINTFSATGTNITITGTEVDGSTTNELQTIANTSDATSHTVTITNTGGSVQFVEGSGITLTTTGTSDAGVVTIAASGGGGGSPSVETLTEWTDDQDNVSINSATTTLRVSGDSGIRGLTSINASGMADGREFNILNVGTNPVVIQAQHPDGSASNKFDILQDVILAPKSGCRAIYDGTSTAFRVIADAATPQKKFGRNVVAGSITAGDWGEIDLVTSGGTITDFAANSNVPSAFSLNTSTSATGKSYILGAKTVNALFRSGYGYLYYRAVVTIPTLSTGTQHFLSYNGLLPSANSTKEGGGNYVVIQYRHDLNGGRWEGWSASSADIGMVDLGVTVVAGTPYTLEIYLNKQRTEARYYIDGVYRGRRTTLLPDNATIMRPTSGIHKISGTTSRSVYVHELEHWGVMSN